jgi:AraC family transcriptional regulator
MHAIDHGTHNLVASLPVRTLLRTDTLGWTSALLHECESPSRMDEPFETGSTPDPVLKLVLASSNRWFVQKGRAWQIFDATRGGLCFTRPRETHRLRWRRATDDALRMIHFYIPTGTMSAVAEEMEAPRGGWIDAADSFFEDATIAHLVMAAARAARDGASDTYAQSAATLIAYHLLSGKEAATFERQRYEHVSDRRLLRVLDFVEAHFDQPLSLETLAAEAGISRYHFATVFKRALGLTPHRHVHEVRLRSAAAMLASTQKSIIDIALSCGFASPSHFAAAFRAAHGESPTAYRARRQGSC